MMTVAGVVFSITIVVLSLASSQFGPRLIWNFMHDIGNQIVLGTFVSTFMYCLLLLGRIRGSGEDVFIPHLSITVGVLLAMASLGVLIYFIHHISASIHASSVTSAIWGDLKEAIDRLFPERIGRERGGEDAPAAHEVPPDFEQKAFTIPALGSGYLEVVNSEALLRIAKSWDLLLRLEYRPGHFIVRGSPLAKAWPADSADETLTEEINRAFILGQQRTPEQDVEFSIHQLVEIAVRALSPGVNDPFTAMTCVDWLGVALCDFLERRLPSPYRFDETLRLRIIAPQFTFPGLMDAAFNKIRQHARTSAGVTIRLLESFAVLASRVRKEQDIASVMRHALMVKRGSEEGLPEEFDKRDVEDRYRRVMQAIGQLPNA